MSDYDVVYLDDERNAPFGMSGLDRRRRPAQGGRRRPGGGSSVMVPASRRPTVVHSGGGAGSWDPYSVPQGQYGVPMGPYPGPAPYYADPRVIGAAPIARFWNLSGPQLIELGAKALAAILPLPDAPTAEGDTVLDVENLVRYQTALADHAKRDERLRTLGELIGRILQ